MYSVTLIIIFLKESSSGSAYRRSLKTNTRYRQERIEEQKGKSKIIRVRRRDEIYLAFALPARPTKKNLSSCPVRTRFASFLPSFFFGFSTARILYEDVRHYATLSTVYRLRGGAREQKRGRMVAYGIMPHPRGASSRYLRLSWYHWKINHYVGEPSDTKEMLCYDGRRRRVGYARWLV